MKATSVKQSIDNVIKYNDVDYRKTATKKAIQLLGGKENLAKAILKSAVRKYSKTPLTKWEVEKMKRRAFLSKAKQYPQNTRLTSNGIGVVVVAFEWNYYTEDNILVRLFKK